MPCPTSCSSLSILPKAQTNEFQSYSYLHINLMLWKLLVTKKNSIQFQQDCRDGTTQCYLIHVNPRFENIKYMLQFDLLMYTGDKSDLERTFFQG